VGLLLTKSSIFLAALLAVGVAAAGDAQAADVRIRLLRQQGKQLHVYHDRAAGSADGTVEVLVGATACKAVPGEVLRPGRGGDSLTTLIVLDRGGTKTTGMGRYTEQIREAVGGFLEGVVGKGPGDKVTIIDTSGRDRDPKTLGPTDKNGDVKAFLSNLADPSGSGADVYGVANLGLAEIDRAGTRLGAVIVISDGIDPAAEKGGNATDNHQLFIQEAKKRGVPVAAVHIGRSGEPGGDATKLRNGRSRLTEVANETNGDVVSVPADANLAANLRKELDKLGRLFAQVDRTTCQLCGKTEAKTAALVDLKVRKGNSVVAQSLGSPPPRMDLAGDDYGACDAAEAASDTGGGVGPACKVDSDCNAESKCDTAAGHCVKRKTAKDLLPWIAAGLLALGALLGLWAWRRSEKRKQQAAALEAAERERQLKEQAETAERGRREAEAERLAALAQAAQASRPQARDPALDQLLNPDVLRLAAAPGSAEGFDRVMKAGVYLFGAGEDADLRLQSGTVSTNHAQLEIERNGMARIMDLGSSNGTFVNQMRINPRQPVELRVGDVIGLSRNVLLQVHALAPSGQAGSASSRSGRGRTMLEE
jgi:hypothetical protein